MQSGSCQHSAAHASCDSAVTFCRVASASADHTCHGAKSVWLPLGAPPGAKYLAEGSSGAGLSAAAAATATQASPRRVQCLHSLIQMGPGACAASSGWHCTPAGECKGKGQNDGNWGSL